MFPKMSESFQKVFEQASNPPNSIKASVMTTIPTVGSIPIVSMAPMNVVPIAPMPPIGQMASTPLVQVNYDPGTPRGSDICRSCMGLSPSMQNIFTTVEDGKTIAAWIEECIPTVVVRLFDDLPQFICGICADRLRTVRQFRQLFLLSDNVLREEYKKIRLNLRTGQSNVYKNYPIFLVHQNGNVPSLVPLGVRPPPGGEQNGAIPSVGNFPANISNITQVTSSAGMTRMATGTTVTGAGLNNLNTMNSSPMIIIETSDGQKKMVTIKPAGSEATPQPTPKPTNQTPNQPGRITIKRADEINRMFERPTQVWQVTRKYSRKPKPYDPWMINPIIESVTSECEVTNDDDDDGNCDDFMIESVTSECEVTADMTNDPLAINGCGVDEVGSNLDVKTKECYVLIKNPPQYEYLFKRLKEETTVSPDVDNRGSSFESIDGGERRQKQTNADKQKAYRWRLKCKNIRKIKKEKMTNAEKQREYRRRLKSKKIFKSGRETTSFERLSDYEWGVKSENVLKTETETEINDGRERRGCGLVIKSENIPIIERETEITDERQEWKIKNENENIPMIETETENTDKREGWKIKSENMPTIETETETINERQRWKIKNENIPTVETEIQLNGERQRQYRWTVKSEMFIPEIEIKTNPERHTEWAMSENISITDQQKITNAEKQCQYKWRLKTENTPKNPNQKTTNAEKQRQYRWRLKTGNKLNTEKQKKTNAEKQRQYRWRIKTQNKPLSEKQKRTNAEKQRAYRQRLKSKKLPKERRSDDVVSRRARDAGYAKAYRDRKKLANVCRMEMLHDFTRDVDVESDREMIGERELNYSQACNDRMVTEISEMFKQRAIQSDNGTVRMIQNSQESTQQSHYSKSSSDERLIVIARKTKNEPKTAITCQICKEGVAPRHMPWHDPFEECVVRKFKCPFCGRIKRGTQRITQHIRKKHAHRTFAMCVRCKNVFLDKFHYGHHVCKDEFKRPRSDYVCGVCLTSFDKFNECITHWKLKHLKGGEECKCGVKVEQPDEGMDVTEDGHADADVDERTSVEVMDGTERLNNASKPCTERVEEYGSLLKALLTQQSQQHQKSHAIVDVSRDDIRSDGQSEHNQILRRTKIRTIKQKAKSAETTRRWRERKKLIQKGLIKESSKKQAKTAAQRMREYRERKKL